MRLPRTPASSLVFGALIVAALAASNAAAQDYVRADAIPAAATRCADFGNDFIDMGNGICARAGTTTRLQMGTRNVSANAWGVGETSSAALRTDGSMHLRVRGGLSASPFQ